MSPSLRSNTGKSVTQSQECSCWGVSSSASMDSERTASRTGEVSESGPNATNAISPGDNPIANEFSGAKNFPSGPDASPSACLAHNNPGAPASFALDSISAICRLDSLAPPARRSPRTLAPFSTAESIILNPKLDVAWVQSVISSWYLRSGRSEPYRSIASAQVSLGKGCEISIPAVFAKHTISPSIQKKISSGSMNEASTSICVNSGWRSERRSSSRKQRAIWK